MYFSKRSLKGSLTIVWLILMFHAVPCLACSRCFESDLQESVSLMAKYIDNIVAKPDEPKTRSIK
jgi:hypothetical protein